jgi:hypothetical protein
MILLLPSVLWHQRMQKHFKCYKQERIYTAEVLSEAAEKKIYHMLKKYKEKLKT